MLAKVPARRSSAWSRTPRATTRTSRSRTAPGDVRVNAQFAVTAVEAGASRSGGPGQGGFGSPGGQRPDETPLTGDNAAKAKAAALAKLPGATVVRVWTDADGDAYEAHVTKGRRQPGNRKARQKL